MKRLFILLGLVTAITANAALYTAASDGYNYTGTPVESFSVDFTKWTTDALPTSWLDADTAFEAGNMAFIKWTLTNRSVKNNGESQTLPTCFNNGTTADATPVKNNATTNKPRIFLPKTSRGVIAVKARIACNKARSLAIYYKDANHDTWTYTSAQVLTAQTLYEITEVSCELNTVGETSIYLQYTSTDYFCILGLELELVDNRSVSLDKHSVLINTDATCNLIATPLPADLALTWSSTNEAVATVQDGVVTTLSAGETDIVVSGGEGITDTCHVIAVPHTDYTLGTDEYWHYSGTAVDSLDVEFSNLSENDVFYTSPNIHADLLWNFSGIGMYKWCYYAQRACGDETYGPLAWNSGNSENGTNGAIKDSQPEKLAAMYFPEIKNGVAVFTIEGWTNNNSRNLLFEAEDAEGNWKSLNVIDENVSSYYLSLPKNEYTKTSLVIENKDIKRLRFWRNSNDYQFITRITITANTEQQEPTAIYNLNSGEQKPVKVIKNGHLVIIQNGQQINVLGQTLK